jgi:hypothetical protein
MQTLHLAVAILIGMSAAVRDRPLRVDVNPDIRRPDMFTRDWDNWTVSATSLSRTFGRVTVTFKGASAPRGLLFKPNYVHGATMASDGVSFEGPVEMVIAGLSPGKHSLVTYHNQLEDAPSSRYDIRVDGVVKVEKLRPTTKAHGVTDVSYGYVEFEATDRPVVVSFTSDDSGTNRGIIINGFEIDTADPRKKAIHPSPPHLEGHADADSGGLTLSWEAPATAASHDVYFGRDRSAVEDADHSSPLFKGNRKAVGLAVEGLSPYEDYYWRVDEVDAAGNVARGDSWHFRPRHLAFPGAEGYGRFARGGRGGRVIEVINLDDSGPGSLRAAIQAEGPRTVVFRVSGVIALKSPLFVAHGDLTIAGQTAPGDGICLRGYSLGTSAGSSDVIIRYIRARVGDEARRALDGLSPGGAHTIVDHCSISWSIDEGLDTRTVRDFTFQKCIISEALDDSFQRHPHGYAASIGGEMASYHHNLLAHCTGRNWSLAGGYDNAVRFAGRLDIRNNVVYNWKHRTTDGGAKLVVFANNYYKPGPASQIFTLMKPDTGSPADPQMYYIGGNVMEGKPEYDDDNWKGVTPNGPVFPSLTRSDRPFFPPYVRTTSAVEAYRDVLDDIGANLPRQDAIDARIIREVREGTFTYKGSKGHLPGIIDTPTDLGPNPWPEYRTYDVPDDSDHDGMPDRWESRRGLDSHSPADANADPDGDGYTNLEDYLNELAARGPSRA